MALPERSPYFGLSSVARPRGAVEILPVFVLLLLAFTTASASESHYSEGQALLLKRKWAEAAVVLRSAIQEEGINRVAVASDLSRALAYSGRREEALSVLGQVVSHERGQTRDQVVRRIRVLSRVFFTNATFQIYRDGVNFMQAQKYRNARERLEQTLTREPDNIEVLVRLGQCLVMDGDYDSAAERLRLAKKLNPYEPEVRLWLGRALHQRGELKEAVEELKAAYSDLEESELAPVWLAEALTSLGDRAGALDLLEEDLKAQPLHLRSLLALAQIRFEFSGKDSRALLSARQTLQLALSRLDQYSSWTPPDHNGGELGWEPKQIDLIHSDVQALMERVESKLEGKISPQKS